MFSPEFTALCDTCGAARMWFKANRVVDEGGGRTLILKGYKCASCDTFEPKVVDLRGRVQARE